MQLDGNNHVEWMIQTRALDQVINVSGGINILDNPSLKAQAVSYTHLDVYKRQVLR